MTSHFFITGLPRSRTAWLANLFTTNKSYCFHEVFGFVPLNKVLDLLKTVDKPYVGISDPYPSGLKELGPNGWPVVVIQRNLGDAYISFLSVFGLPNIPIEQQLFSLLQDSLEKIKRWPNVLVERFENLDEAKTIKRIWEHCMPGVSLDVERLRLLQNLTITKYSKGGM